jgi:hypothetical protein
MSAIFVKMPPAIRSARRAQRLADREADEARPGVDAGDEQQDAQHDEQLDRDEGHPDAHPGLQRDRVAGKRLTPQRCERGAGVGERVDADAEPGDAVASRDAHQREHEDDGRATERKMLQEVEVDEDDRADERLEIIRNLPCWIRYVLQVS